MASIPIAVECYAGHRGEETPRRFRLGERWVEVAELVDAWLAPDHRYFKLRDGEGALYILRHDPYSEEGGWELTLYQAAVGNPDPSLGRGSTRGDT